MAPPNSKRARNEENDLTSAEDPKKIARKEEDDAFDVFGNDDADSEDDDDVEGAEEVVEESEDCLVESEIQNESLEDEDDDEEMEQEDYGDPIRESSVTVTLKEGKVYTFEMALFGDPRVEGAQHVMAQVHSFLTKDQNETSPETCVGYLDGVLLPRPNPSFHDMARALNSEVQELACMFCDSRGIANRVDTGMEDNDVAQGGFLHIFAMEVGKGHQGTCDLGLRLLHEALLFLKGEWTMTVMVPLLLGVDIQRWPEENNRLKIDPMAGAHSQEQHDGLKGAHTKIKRHYSRMGFQQAGRNSEHHLVWFLTSNMYFGDDDNDDEGDDSHRCISRWKSKTEAKDLDIFVAPEKHEPKGLDDDLHSLINEDAENLLAQVEELVRQGSSLHGSRALFLAAADCQDTNLFELLVKLGGDVNTPDENGNTPLHVAVTMMQPKAIDVLLQQGASLEAKNDKQHTALETLEEFTTTMEDFQTTWVLNIPQTQESLNVLECALLLMPASQKKELTDRWLPPRMREMFSITAEHIAKSLDTYIGELFAEGSSSMVSVDKVCDDHALGATRFHFLPPAILDQHRNGGFRKSFFQAWCIIFRKMAQLLAQGQAPNIAALETATKKDEDEALFQEFLKDGGKVEHAVDALVTITRNVYLDGEDGWDYRDYQDKIEKQQPETPLDGSFDIARSKLLELDPDAPPEQLGPYDHSVFRKDTPVED